MRWTALTRFALLVLPAMAIVSFLADEAQARRRGLSSAQIKAIQAQQKAEEEAEQKYQAAVYAKYKEILDRYDLNKNGKIDGTEKPMYDKYIRDIKLGKQPNPILQIPYPKVEVPKTSKSGTTKK